MKLLTYQYEGMEAPGILSSDGRSVIPFSALGLHFADMNEVVDGLSDELRDELTGRISSESAPAGIPLDEVALQAPIPRPRQDILCLGVNYLDHRLESASFDRGKSTPEDTVYFSKRCGRALGSGQSADSNPEFVQFMDYECELAVVLRGDARRVSREDAEKYVFGYTVLNDFTSRDVQRARGQWYFGKSMDGFTAMGPYLVTADEFGTFPPVLDISCTVNGELRQHSNTELQIAKIDDVIADLTRGMTLCSGTVISTGTCGGIGKAMNPPCPLKAGDTVVCEIEGIGKLVNHIV